MSKKKFLIGAPTANREWIVRHWVNGVQGAYAGIQDEYDLGIVLVGEESDGFVATVDEYCKAMRHAYYLSPIEEDKKDDVRQWNHSRYQRMVYLRNTLLQSVRMLEPDYFLSLDTDIIMHPDALVNLLETMEDPEKDASAVGGKLYMTRHGVNTPSYGMWRGSAVSQGIRRRNSSGVFPVNVIMAMKLMNPAAYNIDYEFHTHGEDLGWSANCRKERLKLYWDGRVTNKHVMYEEDLMKIDERVGF